MFNFKVLLLDLRTALGNSYPFWIECLKKCDKVQGKSVTSEEISNITVAWPVLTSQQWGHRMIRSRGFNLPKWNQMAPTHCIWSNLPQKNRVLLVVIPFFAGKNHLYITCYFSCAHVWWTCAMDDGACFGWVLLTLKRLKCPAVPLIEVQIRGYWSLSSDAGPNDFATSSNLTVNVPCVWGNIQCLVKYCS